MEERITASLAEAQYAPLKIAVKKVEARAPRGRIETHNDYDDGAPVGPSEGEEAGYFASDVSPEEASWKSTAQVDETLPKLDELSSRLPKKVLTQIDELFRAQFSQVQRVSEETLK